jgi:hypothetical protein
VQAAGFKTFKRTGVVLGVSERLSVGNLVLQLGDVNERVAVLAEGAAVQTASAERSGAITGTQVEELFVYRRAVTSPVALLPGVVNPTGVAGRRSISGGNVTSFNVNGNRAAENNFTVDGVTMTAVGGAPNGTFGVSTEAVSEMKILLTNYQAEYGRLSGSNVQILLKSGSRDFHGSGLYYKRHEEFDANNFFNNRLGVPRPIDRFNTYTYNIGRPLFIPGKFNKNREKLFFFWNQECVPQKTSSATQQVTTPQLPTKRLTCHGRPDAPGQGCDFSGRTRPLEAKKEAQQCDDSWFC